MGFNCSKPINILSRTPKYFMKVIQALRSDEITARKNIIIPTEHDDKQYSSPSFSIKKPFKTFSPLNKESKYFGPSPKYLQRESTAIKGLLR